MQAVRVHAIGDYARSGLEVLADPTPGPGEVVVAVRAVPVNYVDWLQFTGRYQFTPSLPYTPGKGPAGTVVAVGDGVDLVPGDRVLAMAEYGGHAELATADHASVYRLPEGMGFVAAAAMGLAFDTAWMALRDRARLAPGESVLVLGATGAVGRAAVQLAKAMGAGRVLAGGSSPARLAGLGHVDAVVDLGGEGLRDRVRAQVFEITDGEGVDVVVDPVGGDAFDGAVRALAWRGRLVVVGFAAGRIPTLKMNYPLLKNIEVSGLQISDYRRRRPDLMAECYREVFGYYLGGVVTAPPTTTLPLGQWEKALRMVERREATTRLVLLPELT